MEVVLYVTNKCNWNCDYCITDTHSVDNKVFDELLKKVRDLPDIINSIVLSGGEPGMLSEEQIKILFDILLDANYEINLQTNGLFLEKYPEYLRYINHIQYHCVESLKDDIIFYDTDIDNIDYLIVVKKSEYHLLDEFMEKYPDITFSIMGEKKVNPISISQKIKMIQKWRHRMSEYSIVENLEDCGCKVIGLEN